MATNCNRTLSCISLLEYFLLVSPPLNRVPIPNINTTATETKSITALTLTNISEIINYMYYIFKEKKLKSNQIIEPENFNEFISNLKGKKIIIDRNTFDKIDLPNPRGKILHILAPGLVSISFLLTSA